MAYQMAATAVTLNDPKGHSLVVGICKCNLSNICAAFYTILTDNVLARFLCISRASCNFMLFVQQPFWKSNTSISEVDSTCFFAAFMLYEVMTIFSRLISYYSILLYGFK